MRCVLAPRTEDRDCFRRRENRAPKAGTKVRPDRLIGAKAG